VRTKVWWLLSGALTVLGLAVLITMWMAMDHYKLTSTQITSAESAANFVEANGRARSREGASASPLLTIETGVYIATLKFTQASEVHFTGYIWQRYLNGVHDHLLPKPSEVGFVLPEQVEWSSDVAPREAYRRRTEDGTVVGWFVEATVRQRFHYHAYPFDHKTVWIRLRPRGFAENVVLVPDFGAYDGTGVDDIFGVNEDIVLSAWERQDTFFDYGLSAFDTNFGLREQKGLKGYPELRYNIVVKRKFGDAFVIHLLPLFLVAMLLYGALLTVTDDAEMAGRHGFSTSGVISTCSALFFVVLLAHIQLREQFAGAGIVYLERFYLLMYAVLVAAAAYTYFFAIGALSRFKWLCAQDNILLKTAYWPSILFAMVAVSAHSWAYR
jgi:hypothetical protein